LRQDYQGTINACYLGYITQAIVVNLAPLLFVTFQREFSISLERIGLLVSVNFGVQIFTDLAAAPWIDRTGHRAPVVLAHALASIGLLLMGLLPRMLPDAYLGLCIATVVMAVGGGLIEVLISPIVESCPHEHKASQMSLLHSFYCWGQVLVVAASTAYLVTAGERDWIYLPMIWALIPSVNCFFFARVPLMKLVDEHERTPLSKLFSTGVFYALLLMMVASGAAELAVAQWASLFAEEGLGVSKAIGNLLGPCAFAMLMGLARLFYGVKGSRINLNMALSASAVLCVASYLVAVFAPWPLVSLIACAVTGLSVAMMWPGTLSLSSRTYPTGGSAMFAMLALAGDVGGTVGPGLVGILSARVVNGSLSGMLPWFPGEGVVEAGLKTGLLLSIVFPLSLLFFVYWLQKKRGAGDI